MAVLLQAATPDDIPQLTSLLATLFEQEAEFSADRSRQTAGLRQIIGNENVGTVLVLRDADEVIGMVVLLYTISTALGCRVAILEDMIVRPDRRGGGTGSRLITAAIDHARIAGCGRITLLTDSSNASAQRFYERSGFVRSTMIPMRLSL